MRNGYSLCKSLLYSLVLLTWFSLNISAECREVCHEEKQGCDTVTICETICDNPSDWVAVAVSALTESPATFTPIPVEITFSREILGFSGSDVNVTGGYVKYYRNVNGQKTIVYIEPSENPVDMTVSVSKDSCRDLLGRPNNDSNSLSLTYKNTFLVRPVLQAKQEGGISLSFEVNNSGNGSVSLSRSPDFDPAVAEVKTFSTTGEKFYIPSLSLRYIHRLSIDGLDMDVRYYYRVVVPGQAESSVSSFVAKPAKGSRGPVRIVVMGDTQNNNTTGDPTSVDIICASTNSIMNTRPDFILHLGDHVESGNVPAQIRAYFNRTNAVWAGFPILPVFGNHDFSGGVSGNNTHLDDYLITTGNHNSFDALYYSYSHGNIHILVLCTQDGDMASSQFKMLEPGTAQYAFAENDLTTASQDPDIDHIFVAIHVPLYSEGDHAGGDNQSLIDSLEGLFVQTGVKAVFSGHSHNYQHLVKQYPESNHTMHFIISGGAGGTLFGRNSTASQAEMRVLKSVHNYITIDVDGELIRVTPYVINPDGSSQVITDGPDGGAFTIGN